jgi:tetratricopeptide (TPR) repeat protein
MNSLANSYHYLGRHPEALKLRERTLALRQAKLDPDHPDVLMSMSNLATSYAALGRHPEALKLREQTLALEQPKLGPDHHSTLTSMYNLANSYHVVGRYADAVRLWEQTLPLQQAKLGPDNPDTLWTMHNLAAGYEALGRHPDALRLRQQTLALRQTRLGPNHPHTLQSLWVVAGSLGKLNRAAEAVPIIDDRVRRANGQDVVPGLIEGVMDLRLRHFEKAKDAGGCRATAELWEKLQRTDAGSLYDAACFRAVTAAVLRATDPSSDTAKEADAEADRAMAWLRQAVAAGYKNVAHLKKDTDLDALRDRADFRALLAKLEAGG